jgi:hypothetical protein
MATHTLHAAPAHTQAARCAQRAGWAYSRSGRGKAIATIYNVNVSTGTRYRQGVEYSPLAKALKTLAESPRTTAFPALVEAWITVTQAEIACVPTAALHARRAELECAEADLGRDIFHARMTGEGMRALRAKQADVVLELTAIETELDGRKAGK